MRPFKSSEYSSFRSLQAALTGDLTFDSATYNFTFSNKIWEVSISWDKHTHVKCQRIDLFYILTNFITIKLKETLFKLHCIQNNIVIIPSNIFAPYVLKFHLYLVDTIRKKSLCTYMANVLCKQPNYQYKNTFKKVSLTQAFL